MTDNDNPSFEENAALAWKLFVPLYAEVMARGGTKWHIERLATPAGHDQLVEISRIIVPGGVTDAERNAREVWDWELQDLELGVRTHNTLRRNGRIDTVGQLLSMSEAEVRSIPLVGEAAIADIRDVLRKHGLTLGTKPPA